MTFVQVQKNDTNTETRQERAKRIFNEVKDLITEAKNENTFNIQGEK